MDSFIIRQIFATVLTLSSKIQEKSNGLSDKITLRQFMLMLSIEHIPPEDCNYNRLAEKLSTTKQNVKQIASSLEKKNYLQISPSQKDKRSVTVSMTKSGLDAALEYAHASEDFLCRAAEKYSPEELSLIWDSLKKLYAFDGVEMDGFDDHK